MQKKSSRIAYGSLHFMEPDGSLLRSQPPPAPILTHKNTSHTLPTESFKDPF